MKLIDLEPRWIHPNVMVFLCPHCRSILLSIKNIEMPEAEQHRLFEKEFGEDWPNVVIACNSSTTWSIHGTIPQEPNAAFITDLSVSPSVDASKAGHWHGCITNGEIV